MQKRQLLILAVLTVFTLLTALRHYDDLGEDLTSSYYSSRLLAAHQADHMYSRDPVNFDAVGDLAWDALASRTGFAPPDRLHPFVQTPLWPFLLEPLATHMNFPAFKKLFLWVLSLCLSATIWLIAGTWAAKLMHPGWIALICAVLYLSEAYKYTMGLVQTHVIFLFLTIAALALARRKHSISAGALLAAAAAVKITPGILLIYWLLTRQWRAAASFVAVSAGLAGLSVLATGWQLNLLYLRNLAAIANILLVSANNQSLAALWMAPRYPAAEVRAWHELPLPALVKNTSNLLAIAFAILGGLLDRRSQRLAGSEAKPYGAAMTLVAVTMFASIAWTHYYILLIFPLMLMLDSVVRKRSLLIVALVLVVLALNFDTQTMGGILLRFRPFPIVRAQFFSGLVCIVGLLILALRPPSDSSHPGATKRTSRVEDALPTGSPACII